MFTDIEGSVRLARNLGDAYGDVLGQHRRIIRRALSDDDGVELFTEGDSFFVAFRDASAALRAGLAAQRKLAEFPWPSPSAEPKVRMGIHTGVVQPVNGEYASVEVHRAARVAAAAHGGQILCSAATAAQIGRLPTDAWLLDLGKIHLRGFDEPENLFQLVAPTLRRNFPPPRTFASVSEDPPQYDREPSAFRSKIRSTDIRLPDISSSAAILIGSANYVDPGIALVPSVANNVNDLAAVLTHRMYGGFAPHRTHSFLNPSLSVGEQLADIAEITEDVLFLYYAGHGFVDRDGELYLGLPSTRTGRVTYTALPYRWIRQALLDSPAIARVIVLDCCFSGRAIDRMSGPDEIGGQISISGAYVLTATPPNDLAHAPPGDQHTSFTGELIKLLTIGIPGLGEAIPLGELHAPLFRAMRGKNLPAPQQFGTNTITRLALTRNPADRRLA